MFAYRDILNTNPSEQVKDLVTQAMLLQEWQMLDTIGRNLVPGWAEKYDGPCEIPRSPR